jgi:integrase
MHNPTYLSLSRHGIYYFRMPVPKDKRSLIGKAEIKKTLRTRDPRTALQLAKHEAVAIHRAMQAVEKQQSDRNPPISKLISVKLPSGEDITIDFNDPQKEAELVKELLGGQTAQRQIPDSTTSPHLSMLFADYFAVKAKENAWTEKTTFENDAIFKLFLEIVGDMQVTEFDHPHARRYVDILRKLPPNRNKSSMWRDLSIEQILAKHPEKTFSVSSINRHVGCVSGLLTWCIRQGYITRNPMDGKSLSEKRRRDKQRKAFTSDDLGLIFTPRKKYLHPYYKWLPLMGLYTGARIEELCSLYLQDIKQIDGIWVFDINQNTPDKRLKNPHSERFVPLHHKLIDSGFLDFVANIKHERLYPELNRRRDGYSQNPSRWFSPWIKKLGITGGGKSFHSFRHTFITVAQNQAKIEQPIIRQLVGHADSSMLGRYAKRPDVAILKEAIDKIQFDY